MMKRCLLSVLFAACVLLSGCGANDSPAQEPDPNPPAQEQPLDPSAGSDGSNDASESTEKTLEDLCGEDYAQYLEETVLMQMENRMEKTPEVVYYPVADDTPLSDYVTFDEHTEFELSDESTITLTFPAGTVTDEANGPQSFRIPLP
jgi:hypothetical protein